MSNPQIIQSGYGDLYGSAALPVLEDIFKFNLKQTPSLRNLLAKVISHDREIYQYTELHDLPSWSSVAEGADYVFDAPNQGYDKTLTQVKYGRGFSISEEAVEDGRFSMISDCMVKLAKAARETQESSFIDLFNNGFTSETTADGVAIFSTSHTTPSGDYTPTSRPATDVDLSFSALEDAIEAFKSQYQGDTGHYYPISPKFLLVPTGIELYAKQLVGSSLKADSANNNINPFHNQLQVVSSPHLSDADAWFLLGDPQEAMGPLRIIVRKPIESKSSGPDMGFLNDSMYFKARYREVLGGMHCYGLYGTTGAA